MKKTYKVWFPIVVIVAIGFFITSCALTPKLSYKVANEEDNTGAIKYQLWTSFIHVAPVDTLDKKIPSQTRNYELKGAVARNPYEPIILIEGRNNFLSSTKLTFTPIKNTMLPEKVTVAVEDKLEKRIVQAGEIIKNVMPLFFLSAPSSKEMEDIKDPRQNAIASFKPWTINLEPALKSDDWAKKDMPLLTEKDGIAANPDKWTYTLEIGDASKTSVDIKSKRKNEKELNTYLQSLGDRGVLIYPSCRTATLTLERTIEKEKGEKEKITWVKSFQISDPCFVETVKLPLKGSITFNDCSVAVEPGDQDERDYFDIVAKLFETAKSVWDEQQKQKKAQKTGDEDANQEDKNKKKKN